MWDSIVKTNVLEAVREYAKMPGPLLTTFLVGVCTLLLLYWYFTRNHDYWEKRGVRCMEPKYKFLYKILKMPLHELELENYKMFGSLYGHFEFSRPVLSVGDPILLRDILVKDFTSFNSRREFIFGDPIADKMLAVINGEDWKRIRKIVTPTFTTGKIRRMIGIFKDCSDSLVENFRKESEQGKHVELKRLYGAFTMDVIASSAFSTKINSHNDPDNTFVKTVRKTFASKPTWRAFLLVFFPRLVKMFRISVFDPKLMDFFYKIIHDIIQTRRKTGVRRNDFLQLLLDTAQETSDDMDEEGQEDQGTSNYGDAPSIEHQVFRNATKKNLSMEEVVAQCLLFFFAGHETTTSPLFFATYEMALSDGIQEKAREEVDRVIAEHGNELTYEAVKEMKYIDNVVSETLRKYSPGIRSERMACEDYKLGNTGIMIPKGMIVTIPIYAMHHDPQFFPDPDKFDPERFTAEEKAKRDPYAYLPFGAGPRNCVAMRFALMEIKVCLINVLANFRIKRCAETKVPLEFQTFQRLPQPKTVYVDLEIREDCPLK